jgi:hypothetical protein
MNSKVIKLMVCAAALSMALGVSGICFADNAAEVVIQISYPSGKDYVSFYNGALAAIDYTMKNYYVNVHVTLLDASGNPATAGPAGEDIAGVTATLTTELGSASSIVEDQFLADSADLTFDVVDVGPAARAHVRYACTTGCEPGTDTLEVTVDSLTATAEVEVKAPPAASLVVRTTNQAAVGPVNLFDTPVGQKNNLDIPVLAGSSVYLEVWAIEENDKFTTAPELDGKEVTITAHADYTANGTIGGIGGTIELTGIATATVTMNEGIATGNITIEKAGTLETGAVNGQMRVVLLAKIEGGVGTDQPTGGPPSINTTNATIDRVSMKPKIKNKLIIGTDPSGQGNLIEEKDTWYVLDDNSVGPTTNAMAVFVADEYGNPVIDTVSVKSTVSGPLVDAGNTLRDINGPNGGSSAGGAWNINNTYKSATAKDGLATVKYLCDNVANSSTANNRQEATGGGTAGRGKPLQATLTLADEALTLTSDTTTVYLVRWSATTAPSYLDLHFDTDNPATEVMAGEEVTLFITSASGSSGNPTISEIVEYNDNLVINAEECSSGTALKISKSSQGFDQATDEGLELKAPAPDSATKHIPIPIKIWGECTQAQSLSVCLTLTDESKGLEDIPLYSLPGREIADLDPAGEDAVKISSLPSGVEAQDDDLDANPIVITSEMVVGDNSLLTPASVDTADEYGNVYSDTPSYGLGSDVGVAIVDATRGATITFEEEDVGQTATVTVSVAGVGSRQLSIINITEAVTAGALTCTLEGPANPTPGGEAIIKVKADGTFAPTPRAVQVSIDSASSVADSELRDLSGVIVGDGDTINGSLESGSSARFVVSAPAAGDVTLVVGDASGETTLLDTGTCTIKFGPACEYAVTVDPAAPDQLLAGETQQFSATTACDSTDVTAEAIYTWEISVQGCTGSSIDSNGLYTAPATLTANCTDTIKVTDTAHENVSATVDQEVLGCTPEVAITPAGPVTLNPGDTQDFSAATTCGGETITGAYTWEVEGGTADTTSGDTIQYTAGTTADTYTITVTDTANGDITDTVSVTIEPAISMTVSPDPMLRSRWVPLPVFMTIEGDGTNFVAELFGGSAVSFSPTLSVLQTFPLILGPESIWELIFVMPGWLAMAEDETLTVTVTTDTEVVSDTVQITILPFPLDQD